MKKLFAAILFAALLIAPAAALRGQTNFHIAPPTLSSNFTPTHPTGTNPAPALAAPTISTNPPMTLQYILSLLTNAFSVSQGWTLTQISNAIGSNNVWVTAQTTNAVRNGQGATNLSLYDKFGNPVCAWSFATNVAPIMNTNIYIMNYVSTNVGTTNYSVNFYWNNSQACWTNSIFGGGGFDVNDTVFLIGAILPINGKGGQAPYYNNVITSYLQMQGATWTTWTGNGNPQGYFATNGWSTNIIPTLTIRTNVQDQATPQNIYPWKFTNDQNVIRGQLQNSRMKLLPRYGAKAANYTRGKTNLKILFIGDSLTMGLGAISNGLVQYQTNCLNVSLSAQLCDAIPGSCFGWMGLHDAYGGTHGGIPFCYQTNLTFATNWITSTYTSVGGSFAMAPYGTTNPITYTVLQPCSGLTVQYMQDNGADGIWNCGHFAVWMDATNQLALINANGTPKMASTNLTFTYGYHTFTVCPTNNGYGTNCFIAGIYPTTPNGITFINAGWNGTGFEQWNVGSLFPDPLKAIPAIAPDLAIIQLGVNNYPIYNIWEQQRFANVISNCLNTCDVVLVMSPDNSGRDYTTNFAPMLYATAAQFGTPVIDLENLFTSYAVANAHGLIFDGVHLTEAGYSFAKTEYLPFFPAALPGPRWTGTFTNAAGNTLFVTNGIVIGSQ
jgi:hypothetical protein